MLHDKYTVTFGDKYDVYEFVSEGPKGKIIKLVKFTETNLKDLYNLGFGDNNMETNEIDDLVVTNNEDSQKVLATVAATVYQFTDQYPFASILATGSTKARTRLYKMGISNNLEAIKKDFVVYGLLKKTGWVKFKKNETYDAFLVRRKKV